MRKEKERETFFHFAKANGLLLRRGNLRGLTCKGYKSDALGCTHQSLDSTKRGREKHTKLIRVPKNERLSQIFRPSAVQKEHDSP